MKTTHAKINRLTLSEITRVTLLIYESLQLIYIKICNSRIQLSMCYLPYAVALFPNSAICGAVIGEKDRNHDLSWS